MRNAPRPGADGCPTAAESASIQRRLAHRLVTTDPTRQTDTVATMSRAADPARRSWPTPRATWPSATPGAPPTRTTPQAAERLRRRPRRPALGCPGGELRALADSRADSSSVRVGTRRSAACRLQARSAIRVPFGTALVQARCSSPTQVVGLTHALSRGALDRRRRRRLERGWRHKSPPSHTDRPFSLLCNRAR